MKKRIIYIILALIASQQTNATQLIQGNVKPVVAESGNCPTNVTTTFDVSINTTTYDRANGIFWVGLARGASQYSVSSFQRTVDSSQIPIFQPHATDSDINNKAISMLTMATDQGNTLSQVAGVVSAQDYVFLLTYQNKFTQSDTLTLYNPTLNQSGAAADAINGLAANSCFIFAAVSNGTFGDDNSGIAVVAINEVTDALTQTAAVPGDMGIKAQQLDDKSSYIRIDANSSMPHYPMINLGVGGKVQLVWDSQLCRLYMGVSLASNTSTQVADDGLRSIVVGQVGCCPEMGTLTLFESAPQGAFNNNENNIVGVTLASSGQALNLTVQNMAVMHASTGPSYLIINGGNGVATNQIFALPLVDLCDPTNVNQGVLANKNMFNATTHHFETPVDNNNANLTNTSDPFALVGAGPLPINSNQTISEMFVVGDAVYVSLKIPQDNNNETGILYSQALFDYEGKIERWTPWSKRVWPICGFPNSPSNSQVSSFAIDAVTGKVIAVDGNPQQTVRITEWVNEQPTADPCQNCCSLPFTLNQSLCSGAYTVLDLDQSTRGIGPTIPYRYALFGGTNKVDIALVSTSRSTAAPYDINAGNNNQPYPQTVTCNFCDPTTFVETPLPANAGCATSLEYARRITTQGNTNYFFAGTENGLFVFAHQDGSGFNVNELGLVNTGVLSTGSWQAIATITGSVVDIKTSGNTLYVLTFATSCDAPLQSTLLSIPFTNNISSMFAPSNISNIAQSGDSSPTAVLQNTLIFTAIDIIQTAADGSQEQLVLATNNGIFQSQAVNGVQSVTTAAAAQWTSLGNDTLFYGIGSVDNAQIKTTDWPFNAQDGCGAGTFERSSIYQLNGNDNTNTFQFVPSFFNYYINSCSTNSSCCPPALFEKICYFWSDGGRRFFIIAPTNGTIAGIPCCGKKICCCTLKQLRQLEVTPFNWCEWNICDPAQTVLQDCALRNTTAFYWVQHIGMTGLLLAGTPYGVVALE